MTQPGMNRRTMLGALAGAGIWVTVASCSSDDSSGSDATSPSANTDPVVGSELSGDALQLRMWAEPTTTEIIAGVSTGVFSFGAEVLDGDLASLTQNDSYLGPTLHLQTGQRVQVEFENRLDDECIVHWHGLVVPQDQDGQPPEAVAPGKTYSYDFVVTNPPGTYWYHPHPHQLTGEQVYMGLAGIIQIHGDEGTLPAADNDLTLVLQDRAIDGNGELQYISSMHDTMAGFVGGTLVTNGRADFEVSVRPEPYRLRLLNGANSRTQFVSWSTGNDVHVVATDGHLLPDAETASGVVLTPAQRSDLWVDFSQFPAGESVQLLVADTFVEGFGLNLDHKVAATFNIEDTEPSPGTLPTNLGTEPSFGPEDAVNPDDPKQFVLSTRRAAHWINGTQWEGRVVTDLETVEANTIELWEFVNQSPIAHPMHIHGDAFRVVSRSWDNDGLAEAWETISDGVIESGLRDTVLVWPGQRVQIAVQFAEHPGYFLYHCHILEHEDGGMMRSFLVN